MTSDILDKAILFAAKAHQGQKRKATGQPYILHPMSVLFILLSLKKSNNAFLLGAVAMMHDTVEDCGITIEDIAKEFGYKIAALVEELTTDNELCEKMGKTEYLCEKMLHMSSYALRVKLADRLHNCSDLNSMNEKFCNDYIPQTLHIIHKIETKRKLTNTHKELIKRIKKQIVDSSWYHQRG